MRERAAELEPEMAEELERCAGSLRAEIVPYGAYETEGLSPPSETDQEPTVIPIERAPKPPKPAG